MKKLYAAYGSNLNHAQMEYRCPDATVYGTAELKNHELLFRGSPTSAGATVEPKEGGSVPILLWEISKKDEHALDRYEGWPSFYGKEQMDFQLESGETVSAMVYVMTPGHELGSPSGYYYATIEEGYHDCGFDTAILNQAREHSEELAVQEQGSSPAFRMW